MLFLHTCCGAGLVKQEPENRSAKGDIPENAGHNCSKDCNEKPYGVNSANMLVRCISWLSSTRVKNPQRKEQAAMPWVQRDPFSSSCNKRCMVILCMHVIATTIYTYKGSAKEQSYLHTWQYCTSRFGSSHFWGLEKESVDEPKDEKRRMVRCVSFELEQYLMDGYSLQSVRNQRSGWSLYETPIKIQRNFLLPDKKRCTALQVFLIQSTVSTLLCMTELSTFPANLSLPCMLPATRVVRFMESSFCF